MADDLGFVPTFPSFLRQLVSIHEARYSMCSIDQIIPYCGTILSSETNVMLLAVEVVFAWRNLGQKNKFKVHLYLVCVCVVLLLYIKLCFQSNKLYF